MSAWLVHLPPDTSRTDLGIGEALEYLRQPFEIDADQIVLAPDTGKVTAPKVLTGILEAACKRCSDVVLLLPPGARLNLPHLPVRVLYGPPFAPPAPTKPETSGLESDQLAEHAKTSGSFLSRLLRRHNPGRSPRTTVAKPELPDRPCRLIALQPVAGGVGATTLAVNLAAELSRLPDPPEICLIDLNPQFGNIGTYLDLPASSRITDAYRQLAGLDFDSFQSCLIRISDHLRVFTAPAEILPVDGITERDLRRILTLARDCSDLTLLDMPHLVTDWSGTAWSEADLVFTISRADVRSAQNMRKFLALIQAERLADGKLFHLLNNTPTRPDADWLAACTSFETGIRGPFLHQFPSGGDQVTAASNTGVPLYRAAPANALRNSILGFAGLLGPKIARRLREMETG